jgi:hypothetical protein
MPRYFFTVVNDVKTQDFDGTELIDLEAAKVEAQKDIDEITQSEGLSGDLSRYWIEICDQSGAVLLIVPFSKN